jgi:cytochrome P450
MAEIDEATDSGNLSVPVSYSDGIKLQYLQAVIKEAMRLHPAVGVLMPRYVPKGGAEIDGRWFPGGTKVGVNAWVVHMDRGVFGADADIFRPERFLEKEGKARERNLMHVSLFSFSG